MTTLVKTIDVAGLKAALHDGGEIALLDAREEVPFDARHILMALVASKCWSTTWCRDELRELFGAMMEAVLLNGLRREWHRLAIPTCRFWMAASRRGKQRAT